MSTNKNKLTIETVYVPEAGEEALALLIKEAGEDARKRKKKAMAVHFKKIHAAVYDTAPPFDPTSSP